MQKNSLQQSIFIFNRIFFVMNKFVGAVFFRSFLHPIVDPVSKIFLGCFFAKGRIWIHRVTTINGNSRVFKEKSERPSTLSVSYNHCNCWGIKNYRISKTCTFKRSYAGVVWPNMGFRVNCNATPFLITL